MRFPRIIFAACWLGGALLTGAAATLKVGMVSDTASFKDAGFNQACRAGLQRAMRDFKVEGSFRESRGRGDYQGNLADLVRDGCGLIIGVGALMQADLAAVAEKNPGVKFALVDGQLYPPLANVRSLLFNVDEAAFQAGFLAAGWADFKRPSGAKVGYVGGVKIGSVEQVIVPYQAGVAYFNRKYGRNVRVEGGYADTFENPRKGRELGEALMTNGVAVIFAAAGHTGAGALAAARERGGWGIGVDVDQYFTLPDVKDCLLTSCLKKMDLAVYALVKEVLTGRFGGGVATGTLANGQVGLAPYHGFDRQIPERLKVDLAGIQEALKNNRVATGWPPE